MISFVHSRMPNEDPFADPHPRDANPGVSPADTIRVPEYVDFNSRLSHCTSDVSCLRPLDPRSPREDAYQPVISMPLPSMQDVVPGQ